MNIAFFMIFAWNCSPCKVKAISLAWRGSFSEIVVLKGSANPNVKKSSIKTGHYLINTAWQKIYVQLKEIEQ